MASYNVYHILLSYIMCMSYIIDHNVWYDTLSYTVKTLDKSHMLFDIMVHYMV